MDRPTWGFRSPSTIMHGPATPAAMSGRTMRLRRPRPAVERPEHLRTFIINNHAAVLSHASAGTCALDGGADLGADRDAICDSRARGHDPEAGRHDAV